MLAVSGAAGWLPGAGTILFKNLSIDSLMKFGIAVALVCILFAAYRQAVCVLGHFAREVYHLPARETNLDASALLLAWSVVLLVYICLIYWIFVPACSPILAALTSGKWPYRIMDICSLAVAVAAIIGIFIATSPLFGKVGDAVAQRVGTAPEEAPQAKCPKCGVLYTEESRYCAFCGEVLPRTPKNTDGVNAGL